MIQFYINGFVYQVNAAGILECYDARNDRAAPVVAEEKATGLSGGALDTITQTIIRFKQLFPANDPGLPTNEPVPSAEPKDVATVTG
jgi:hypothetical protein